MSHTSIEALRTTMVVDQIGSKLARSACGTKRRVRAAVRWEIAGVLSPPVTTAAPAIDLRNPLLSIEHVLGQRAAAQSPVCFDSQRDELFQILSDFARRRNEC